MAERPPAAPSDPQEHLLAFLSDGRSYGLPSAEVERITTHAAHVFLVGKNAYKMKRAVRYSFLDFTTLDRRRGALEEELALNRRTAPVLYRRLVPVTRADGDRLALAGSGEPVEWLLEMARFDQEARLDHIAERGQLTPAIVDDLAAAIAAFLAKAAVRTVYGGYAGMREVIEGNAEDFAALPEAIFGAERTARLTGLCRDELVKQRDLLEERRRSGHVRRCHGDLHLGNIVLLALICYPVAYGLVHVFGRWSTLLTLLFTIPLFVSENIRLYGWVLFFIKNGVLLGTMKSLFGIEMESILFTLGAILLGMVYVYLPFMLFPMTLSVAMVPNDTREAARDLGASRWQVFREVELPLSMPGILIGCLLTFVLAVGAIAEAKILGGQRIIPITHDIEIAFTYSQNWPLGAALAVLLMLLVGVLVISALRRFDLDQILGRR